jgi:DNA-binding NarL/FixJ family response regulator
VRASDAINDHSGECPRPYQVVIIDDHDLFSTALSISLRSQGFEARTLAVAGLPELAGQPAGDVSAGLVILDLHLGKDAEGKTIMGHTWVRGLRARGWQVLMVTGSTDNGELAAAIAEGAAGVLPKESSFDELTDAVVRLARGESLISEAERREWQDRNRVRQVRERYLNDRLGKLTAREREVLELLADGLRPAAAAAKLVVALSTVRSQIQSILTKLQVNSQLEAVALFREERG